MCTMCTQYPRMLEEGIIHLKLAFQIVVSLRVGSGSSAKALVLLTTEQSLRLSALPFLPAEHSSPIGSH